MEFTSYITKLVLPRNIFSQDFCEILRLRPQNFCVLVVVCELRTIPQFNNLITNLHVRKGLKDLADFSVKMEQRMFVWLKLGRATVLGHRVREVIWWSRVWFTLGRMHRGRKWSGGSWLFLFNKIARMWLLLYIHMIILLNCLIVWPQCKFCLMNNTILL